MGSEAKVMKYRRRARVSEEGEYGQCSDRGGAVDWGALKQADPMELLRKLDEIRDQITRSCEIGGKPREELHPMSRRTTSLRPSRAEPPPPPPPRRPGQGPEFYRARYAGGSRYGGSGLPRSPHDRLQQRSVCDERYGRQPSGRIRQQPEGQWENYGYGHGDHHHTTCQCAQCLHDRRAVMQEEHIPMARFFAGQQASHLFERSQSISSEYDRRSVASSLYSHLSISKRRIEYFRKKAESFCRPVRGAAPFVVCSSCNHLLQLLPEKYTAREQIQVQCGSCSEIVTFKLKEVKVHPLVPASSFPSSKTARSSIRQVNQSFEWYQHQDNGNSSFRKLHAHDRRQQNKDFSDSLSMSSTASSDRTEKKRRSNRSIQLKPVSASRSRFADSPKDILCQGDADGRIEASALSTVSPQAPILEDKCVDPFSSQQKDCNGGDRWDRIASKEYSLNSITDFPDAHVRGERTGRTFEPKSREGHKDGSGEETINQKSEQNGKQGNTGFCDAGSMGNKYKEKASNDDNSSLECGGVSKKYEEKIKQYDNSFEAPCITKRRCNKEDNNAAVEVKSIAKICEEENIEDDYNKLLSPNSENAYTPGKNESSVNGRSNTSSRVYSEADLDEIQSSACKSGDSSFFGGFLKKGFKDLSLFNQSVDSVKVSVNGHPISERALRKAEKKAGPVGPGSYWYDYRAGFWGVMGHECSGIIPPFIKEFNYSIPKDCAGGNTGVLVNGRELHQKDLDLLVKRGLPSISGKSYSVEISGNVIDEASGKKLPNLGKLAPTIEKVKRGFGMHIPEEIS